MAYAKLGETMIINPLLQMRMDQRNISISVTGIYDITEDKYIVDIIKGDSEVENIFKQYNRLFLIVQ